MLQVYDDEIDVTVDDNDSCLCIVGMYDADIIEELDMEYHCHDDGSITIISFPPLPTSSFQIET
jgi:hypothetical protein